MRVAVLGMGAMGSRIAASLLKAGHSVTVWNRTIERTKPLVEQGASAAASPRAAAEGADAVLSMVRDDEASRRVWLAPDDGALAAMSGEAIGIESSTLTPDWVRDLAASFTARGVPFLDAPVVGTRAQAESVTLIHLVGGDAMTIARAQPLFSAIGNAAHHAGSVGSGAALKLLVNALLTTQVAIIGELLGAAERLGLDRRRAGEVIGMDMGFEHPFDGDAFVPGGLQQFLDGAVVDGPACGIEIQHRIDHDAALLSRVPDEVADRVGRLVEESADFGVHAALQPCLLGAPIDQVKPNGSFTCP